MGQIKLSKSACMNAILYSNEASEGLGQNIRIMDSNVNSQFSGLHDPVFQRYLNLSESMQGMLKQVSSKMKDISTYCKSVMQWMDSYSEL